MAKDKGWITLDRQLMDNWLYKDKPFNKSMAWIDLLLLADYETHESMWRGSKTVFKRGDVNLSMSQLAERWGWSRKKVVHFLKQLEGDNMVSVKATTRRTTVTIVKYGVFQTKGTTKDTTKVTTDGTSKVTTDGAYIKNNKEKKKEIKESLSADFSDHTDFDDEGWMDPMELQKMMRERGKS